MMEKLKNGLDQSNDKFDFDYFLKRNKCEFGRYQKFLICLLCIPGCFLSAFGCMDLVFMAFTPNHLCKTNISKEFHQNNHFDGSVEIEVTECNYILHYKNGSHNHTVKQACHSWNYDKTYFEETIVTQWNLVCNNAVIVRIILSLLNISTLIGALSLYVQDRWGRKKAFLLNLTIFLTGNCTSLLATNPLTYGILKFIGGMTSIWEISYCWGLEFVGPSKRTALTTVFSVTYGFAVMSLALLAYLCSTWIEIGICITAPFILLYSYAFVIPESPRWLLSQGRIDEALEFVRTMARWENIEIDLSELHKMASQEKEKLIKKSDSSSNYSEDQENVYSVKKFFASRNLRWKCFVLTLLCIVSNQLYFAVPYNVENLRANFYWSYVMQAAVEAPATLLNLFLLNRFGRILPLSLSLFLSGLCCLLSWPTQNLGLWGPVVMAALARFFVCIGVAIIEQLGGELFPTVYRGISQSVGSVMLSIVSVSTQYIIHSSHIWIVLPMLIMGSLMLVASIIALFLPETKSVSLPDTVSQAELQGSVGIVSLKRNLNIMK